MARLDAHPVPPTRVLLVEHLAHRRYGHYMARLRDIAEAMVTDGHEVHILSASGLAIESEGGTIDGLAGLHLPVKAWSRLQRLGIRLWPHIGPARDSRPATMPRRVLGVAIGQVAAVRGIAACVRELGRPRDTAVLVLSSRVHVGWATVLAPLDARWTVHAHRRPPSEVRTMAVMARVGQRLARWRARHRQARGGRVDFLCGNAAFAQEWGQRHPWLEPQVVHLSGVVDLVPAPKDEARAALGLEPTELIALKFGADHGGKDLATIFLAFAGSDAPAHLVGAGDRVDVNFDDVRRSHPHLDFPKVTVLGGAQSDEIRHLLHSAADFAVLSFRPDRTSDSGTLTDAASYGLAVCCSDQSLAGALVDEYGLGLTYRAGDPDSLRDAVARMGCFTVDAGAATRFGQDHSMISIARRMLVSAIGDG